jgi:hypothetical protein
MLYANILYIGGVPTLENDLPSYLICHRTKAHISIMGTKFMPPTTLSLQKDLDYYKSSRIKLSDITEVQIALNSRFKTKDGAAAVMSIASGAYQEEPIPPTPDLSSLDMDFLEYELAKKICLSEIDIATKARAKDRMARAKDRMKRFQIYKEILSLCSESTKDEVAMDLDLDLLHNDPLRFLQLLIRNILTSATTNINMAISDATDAYGSFRQGSSMSVADFKREFETTEYPDLQAISCINRLDKARYNGLPNNLADRFQAMPSNLDFYLSRTIQIPTQYTGVLSTRTELW